ncbi:dihydropteroate synthase [Lutibacter sp.]|uniref:dihydropteroate synthase n=1 Tax=Lutibacter sp. TaxID=1925666 RepID=UPI0025C4BDB1|nr:dihydropteroate synthase [Lutibacter sp.]MCF6182384.1 dihydropteroate synthase [Lutibacter sp.]
MYSINCKGNLVDLSSPKVMGILNITPNSFFDGGKYSSEKEIIKHVEKMLLEDATFIDIGAYSSKPGAKPISEKEELERILPIIKTLVKTFPKIIISIDTFRSEVAKQCVLNGAAIINDISAGSLDKNMFRTIAELQVPYIIMHMQGIPVNMQLNPTYDNVVQELLFYFSNKIAQLRKLGVNDIITDVGFGFGKSLSHNYQLLKHLELFKNLEVPSLVGISRKSMLYKPLEINPESALNATTSANTIALLNGANILRVHDVKEAKECIKIVNLLKENS